MRVFIGWSGDPSKAVARCLNRWLPRVLQEIKPFFSEEAITPGSSWINELLSNLQHQDFFIACVTQESLREAWFIFEIGVAAGALFEQPEKDKRVCPVLYDIAATDVPQPVGMFQGVTANEGGIRRLVEVLNSKLERRLSDGDLAATFEVWWPDLKQRLEAIGPNADSTPRRTEMDILAEVLAYVRQQSSHFNDLVAGLMHLAAMLGEIRAQVTPRPSTPTLGGLLGLLPPVRGAPLPTEPGAYETALQRELGRFTPGAQ